jgi:hypothetical protein
MAVESIPAYATILGRRMARVYNEAAFRHFLAVDRWRAERSSRSFFLILVTIRQSSERGGKIADATAAALFRGLDACVREVDFIGWFREGRVAGAVLPQGANASGTVPHLVATRLLPILKQRLPAGEAGKLRIRVVRLGNGLRS